MYCEAFEEFIEARSEIDREGATCMSDKGGAYQHPAVGRKNKAIARMKQFGALFGMSPVGESELPAGSGAVEQQEDRLTLLKYERQKANGRTNK
jgi:P27 family predicted phage terminase small subunit